MKKKGLKLLGKIAVVMAFLQVCFVGNVSAQGTGYLDMPGGYYGINALNLDFDGPTTVEMWTRGIPREGIGKNVALWASRSQTAGFIAYFNGTDGMICFEWGQLKKWLSPGAREADTWMHLAFVIDNKGGLTLYRDGVNVAGYTPTPEEEFSYKNITGTEKMWVGAYEWWKDDLDGNHSFADVRVWSCARTATEIAANYQGTLPSGTPNLVVNYTFMEGAPSETVANSAIPGVRTGELLNNGPHYTWGKIGVTPTNLEATSQTSENFTLTWEGGSENTWEVALRDAYWETSLDTVSTNSLTLAGLPEGAYVAEVRALWPIASSYSEEKTITIGASGIAQQFVYDAVLVNENGSITLKGLEGSNDILVYNASGAMLHQLKTMDSTYKINAASWESGVYFLNVKNGQKTKNFKVVL